MSHLPPGRSATDYWLPCKDVNPLKGQVRVNTLHTHTHIGSLQRGWPGALAHSHSDKRSAMLTQRLRLWQWVWNPVSVFVWRWRCLCATCGRKSSWASCSHRSRWATDGAERGNYSDPVWWQWAFCRGPAAVWHPMRTIHLRDLCHGDKFICLCRDLCRTQSGISFIYSPPNRIAALSLALAARHRLSYGSFSNSPLHQPALRVSLQEGGCCICPHSFTFSWQ